MCDLEEARPARKKWRPRAGICPGVYSAEQEVEGQSPVCQMGEIRERSFGGLRSSMCAIPAEDEEECDEGIQREQASQDGKYGGREEP